MKNQQSNTPPSRTLLATAILFLLLLSSLLTASVSSAPPASANLPSALSSAPPAPQTVIIAAPYRQTNLLSDLPGVAFIEDPLLVNPWGVALTSNSPFWVVNNGNVFATLYKGDVAGSPLVRNADRQFVGIETIPTVAPMPTLPTAVVANTTSDFVVRGDDAPSAPAHFILASEWGVITAWQPSSGPVAFVVKFVSGHMHTGLAIGSNASGNLLYAADFRNGSIDVFDKDFNLTSVPGNFVEDVPGLFHPFNIQNIGGQLYVTYAEFNQNSARPNRGAGRGFVRRFNTNGVRDTTFAINGVPLDAPWGIALAPANFGAFSNKLLVGNFGAGGFNPSIGAFDPTTGAAFGFMTNEGGANLNIDSLWSLAFGNGVNGGDPNTLYFTAGIFSERHGLFGSLKPVPELPPSRIQFSNMNWNNEDYFVSENGGHMDITVTRTGNLSGTATVNYATVDGSASQFADYEIALGKLTFNPGETSKTFRVLIVDDKDYAGGSHTNLNLVLSNATGAGLATPAIAKLLIQDNEGDTPGQPPNASDDPALFVRQQYYDFLNRVPDDAGFNFWLNQITSCGSNQQCVETRRINVSAAFFLSIEFQRTGMTAYLTHRLASGGFVPRYGSFMRDIQALQRDFIFGAPGANEQLEANKQAFFNDFVTRPEFVARFGGLSNVQYVDTLLTLRNVGFSQVERDALVNGLNAGTETRATVLRKITENEAFRQRELNTAFVLLEYFGYLRRNPDDSPDNNFSGFNFWLNKLNSFNGNYIASEMVKAFIKSTEYRRRFGPP